MDQVHYQDLMKFALEYQDRAITDFKEKNFVEMKYFYDTVSKLVSEENQEHLSDMFNMFYKTNLKNAKELDEFKTEEMRKEYSSLISERNMKKNEITGI